ncbi:uncharacterized protein LOC110681266, partial [Aedes aegypti]|uniref:Uncharacterized protein n=1 Tax=Aedes aegypti TaxID=7159 RepID=A0A903VFB7_AEDAE
MLNLLGNPNLPPRHVVLALKLTQLSIEHGLSPNLALLMDNIQGSGLEYVGRIIFTRLHDINWEVRDSALELLASVVEISEIKFPSFQKHILDCNIIPVVEGGGQKRLGTVRARIGAPLPDAHGQDTPAVGALAGAVESD